MLFYSVSLIPYSALLISVVAIAPKLTHDWLSYGLVSKISFINPYDSCSVWGEAPSHTLFLLIIAGLIWRGVPVVFRPIVLILMP